MTDTNIIQGDTSNNIGGRDIPGAEGLWREPQCADFLGVNPRTLIRWRQRGEGPDFIRFPGGPRGTIRYRPETVRRWLAEREGSSSAA